MADREFDDERKIRIVLDNVRLNSDYEDYETKKKIKILLDRDLYNIDNETKG